MSATAALLPQHQALIDGSAISPDVAARRGYRSVTTKADLARLGFASYQQNVPGLLNPIWSAANQPASYQIRPDQPRIKDGKPLKYESPAKTRNVLDVPPSISKQLADPSIPLWITEGCRKADSGVSHGLCCIDLLGVWGWRGRNDADGVTALADWELIHLKQRAINLVFDSDVMTKREVGIALARFAEFLKFKDAQVKIVYLDPQSNGAKVGLDDYFAAGGTVAGLLARAEERLRPVPAGNEDDSAPYISTPSGILFRKQTQNGPVDQLLTNFTARIEEEVIADDGANERAELAIQGTLSDGSELPRIRVPMRRFPSLDWVYEWGTRPRISAGMGAKDRAREAIQYLSPQPERRRVFEHPGWRTLPDVGPVYLHAGGAIGADGPVPGVDVALRGAAARILLPDPPSGEPLREAVRTCLSLLDVAPDVITAPLFAAVYRAVLCELLPADVSLFLVGPTGVFKSELAALVMQHVGAGFNRLNMPAHFAATANFLERVAFDFKDAPLVIDDFAPGGSQNDIARLHATADRVFRGAGNRGGRGRMHADGTLRPDFPPRGLVIGTGEDAPRGQSLRSRMVILEVAPGDVQRDRLTAAQDAGRRGVFVAGLAGFIQWVAPQYDALCVRLPKLLGEFRAQAFDSAAHARTPDAVAHLALGWWAFLRFAADVEALTQPEAQAMFERAWAALGEAAARQASHQAGEEPARRFLDLLSSALAGGFAHIAAANGGMASPPGPWGWREVLVGAGEHQRYDWREQGIRAGWLDGEDLYLDLDAALAAVQRVSQATGSAVAVGPKTLAKRLHERGFLVSTEQAHGDLRVRRTLEGRRRGVLHLSAGAIAAEESRQSRQSRQDDAEPTASSQSTGGNGGISWRDFSGSGQESRQETPPERAESCGDGGIGGVYRA